MNWSSAIWRLPTFTLIALAITFTSALGENACGRDTDCTIGNRVYRIVLPKDYDGANTIGAIVFAHGFRGTAAKVMQNEKLISLSSKLGLALIAAQAAGPEWNIPHIPSVDALVGIDELTYFDQLIADVVARFAIDESQIVMAGFSSGAMMVWHLACYRGSAFAGFVPMSGTLWEPLPDTCLSGPVNLIHYHGTDDKVVPIHGRRIKDAYQGDVVKAFSLVARNGNFKSVGVDETPDLKCSRQVDDGGYILEFCQFPGGHRVKTQHFARAVRLFLPD